MTAGPTVPDLPDLKRRAFASRDLADVVALHIRAFCVLGRDSHSAEQIDAHTALVQDGAYAEDLARSHLTLALSAGMLVATAGWLPLPDEPGTARIRKVFVEPGTARRGLASWLVRSVEREAAGAGCTRYWVRANLNAVPLYRRLGYRGIEAGSMDTPTGVALPVLFMRRDRTDTRSDEPPADKA